MDNLVSALDSCANREDVDVPGKALQRTNYFQGEVKAVTSSSLNFSVEKVPSFFLGTKLDGDFVF